MLFLSGIFLVVIFTKPPEKSAGSSAAGDLNIMMFSIAELGMTSKEKAFTSASELGVAALFSHTLLYRCDNPLTIKNLSFCIVIPGTLFTTSEASLSRVLDICCADIPIETKGLALISVIIYDSVFVWRIAVTETSPRLT